MLETFIHYELGYDTRFIQILKFPSQFRVDYGTGTKDKTFFIAQ